MIATTININNPKNSAGELSQLLPNWVLLNQLPVYLVQFQMEIKSLELMSEYISNSLMLVCLRTMKNVTGLVKLHKCLSSDTCPVVCLLLFITSQLFHYEGFEATATHSIWIFALHNIYSVSFTLPFWLFIKHSSFNCIWILILQFPS